MAAESQLESIQLDAFVLPDDHSVFKVFPGKGYRFYDVIKDTSTVFLDIRGLDVLSDSPATWNDKEVLAIIAADRANRRPAAKPGSHKKRRSGVDQRDLGFLKGLLLQAKKGDLLVVPAEGYRRDVLIGEIVDDPGSVRWITAKDGDGTSIFAGRAVQWRAVIEKRHIEPKLLDRLHTPIAFFVIEPSLREQLYELAFESYVYKDVYVSTFRTSKERFTSADNLIASIWFNGLAATRNAVEQGQGDTIASQHFVSVALLPTGAENQNELELNINSPGTILVRSAGVFAFALMALSPLSAPQAQSVADGNVRITLRPVGGANPNCAVQVEAAVAEYVRSLGPTQLLEACEFGRKTRQDASLKTRVRLKTVSKRLK